ncbi:MAG: hypothetical protein GY950_37675 [bacterium]|nr:hypothetical protein [bacterium]
MAEILYVLYLLSGLSKVFLNFFGGGIFVEKINITLVLAVLLVLVNGYQWFKNGFLRNKFYVAKGSFPSLAILFLFYAWMIFTLLYTVSPGYSYMKTFLFLTNVLAFMFPLTYKGFNIQRFVNYFIVVGSVFIVLYLSFVPRSYSGYLTENLAISGKYLDVGYLAALNVLILLLLFSRLEMSRAIKFGFAGLNFAALVITGARGPLMFLLLVLLLRLLFNPHMLLVFIGRMNLKKVLIIIVAAAILVVGMYNTLEKFADNIERSLFRLQLVTDPESGSLAVRFDQLAFSFDKIFDNTPDFLLGRGVGSFGILYEGEDKRRYPHNIVVETWFEMGFVGMILLLLFLFLYLRKIRLSSPYTYIFLYLFLNSLKSSSIVDLRIMFGIMACLLVFSNFKRSPQMTQMDTD